jgi:hypothetical protein
MRKILNNILIISGLFVLLLTSCTPKCSTLIQKCKDNGCLKDSSFVSIRDSVVIKDSVYVHIKDSIVYTQEQSGSISVPVSGGESEVKLAKGGWIKAHIQDSIIVIEYYIPPTKEVYREETKASTSDKEKVKESQSAKTTTIIEEVEIPIPKWIKILATFGGISIFAFIFWIYKKFT